MPIIAVGKAFDFIAGTKPQAPSWMQSFGLEWLFRLASEARQLWRRCHFGNPAFLLLLAAQCLAGKPNLICNEIPPVAPIPLASATCG